MLGLLRVPGRPHFPPGPAKHSRGGGHLASGTSLQTLAPHVLPEPVTSFLCFPISSLGPSKESQDCGKSCEPKTHLEYAGGPGRLSSQASPCHKPGKYRRGRAGFSRGLGLAAFLPGGAWGVMVPAGGWDESGPEVFSSHGFSSQVRILAAEGRAWSRRLGNPQRPQHHPRIGRSREESGLPISDLQPVPSCFTFSSFHVAARSPVMGSAEASSSPDHCLREEPKWGSLPGLGHLALTFSVALSCLKTLCPRTSIMTASLEPPSRLPFLLISDSEGL